MVLILAQVAPVPEAPAPRQQGLTHQWIGWDGSVWNIADGAEGVLLLVDGVEGMHFPKIDKHRSAARTVPGSRLRSWRATDREVFWPVLVDRVTSEAFVDVASRFFRTIHPELPGTWRVGFNGAFRDLSLTGAFDDSHADPREPVYAASGTYKVTLEAAQPYWEGEPVQAGPWFGANPEDYYGGDDSPSGGPPFIISESETLGSATMTNPGDVPAFPKWTITGTLSDIEVGVGDRLVDVPFTVDDGETLVIDTDPRHLFATLDGEDVTATLGFQKFAPIPAGGEVSIHVEGTGDGSITCELVPLYFRAF